MEGVILVVGRVIFRLGRPDRGLPEASWRRNGRLLQVFWGFSRVSWGPGELCQQTHTAATRVLVEIETGRHGICVVVLEIETGRQGIR